LQLVDGDRDWLPALPRVLDPLDACTARERPAVVAPGTGDNMAAALGVALAPGDVAISIGTSGTAYTVAQHPTADPTGAVAGFADATGRYLPLVCTLNATKVTDAVARLLGVTPVELDALALDAQPGARGVVVVPYFDGERTPNRPDARGTITGLSSDVTREDLARAAFEGVVCGLLDAVDALAAAGVDTSGRIVLAGGGARSRAYQRVLADLSGRAVSVPAAAEHVAAGACVHAAAVLHRRAPTEVACEWQLGAAATVEPDATVDRDAVRGLYAHARG
jgi:xylulokinase